MRAPTKILVAIDGTESTEQVLREALLLAKTFGASLALVHAIPEAAPLSPGFEILAAEMRERLDELASTCRDRGVQTRAEHTIRFGAPENVIESARAELDCDWVVLGAGNKSTLDRFLLGSTVEAVLRVQTVPVWVVRPGALKEVDTILVAVDDSPQGREALQGAAFLARSFVAHLRVLTIGALGMAERLQDQLRATIDLHGVEHEFVARSGEVSAEILAELAAHPADLLTLGHAGRRGLVRLFRANTAESLTRHSPCSILCLHVAAAPKSTAPLARGAGPQER